MIPIFILNRRRHLARSLRLTAAIAWVVFPGALAAQTDALDDARRILATSSLAAKEYAEGVSGGSIVSSDEVEEAKLFVSEARRTASDLAGETGVVSRAMLDSMAVAIAAVRPPAEVTDLADRVAAALRAGFTDLDEIIPALRAPVAIGAGVYARACASCHGDRGAGDGPASAGLSPRPSDFTDATGLIDQSPLDFYRKISIGVAGTAMPAFDSLLTPDERWAVAWYSTRLRATAEQVRRGADRVAAACVSCGRPETLGGLVGLPAALADPATSATVTDAELLAQVVTGAAGAPMDSATASDVVAYLRTLPFAEGAADGAAGTLARVRTVLARARRDAASGDPAAAARAVIDAYAEFEGVEADLTLRHPRFVTALEADFGEFRGRIVRGDDAGALDAAFHALVGDTFEAQSMLDERPSVANLFVQSFVLLIREGIEALLIVGALVTLVARAGARHRQREIWWGVGAGVVASLLTAVALETIFTLNVAHQEALEGITMLAATLVLISVSYWLISKVEAQRWKAFVASHATGAISGGSMMALGLGAFLAVYREGFETVLFYKALIITAEGTGAAAIVSGAAVATLALVGVYLGIRYFGLRIPLRPFFAITSAVLLYMAFSFAGRGIAELQESQVIGITLLDWVPRVPWIGIYPTAQSLALQAVVLALIVGGLLWTFVFQRRARV